jgi:MFS family permease
MSVLPHTFKFFWAPLPDTTFTRRGWYFASNVLSSLTLIGLALVPIRSDTLQLLRVLIFVNSLAVTFLGMAVEGLLAHTVSDTQRGTASGWLQAGNLGGAGLGGGLALFLAQRLGAQTAFIIVAVSLMACSLTLRFVPEPVRISRASLMKEFGGVLADLKDTILRTRVGLLAMLLCLLPTGAAAAAGLFSAMADRWATSADKVALYTGLLAGIVSAVGCLAGGWLSDRFDRKTAYALSGLFLAVVAVGMYLGPRNELGYGVFTLLYQFGAGVSYGAFTGFVLEAIGRGAAATKYNVLASLSNIPIWYMTTIDGWASERHGVDAMLLVDAASEVVGTAVFLMLVFALLGGARRRSETPT